MRTGLYFVDAVFWDALPRVDADLERALAEHYPGLTAPAPLAHAGLVDRRRPRRQPERHRAVTAETLRLHRGLAVERHRRALQDLARRLSLSDRRCPPPPALHAWLAGAPARCPTHVAYLEQRYGDEPYRLALSLLAADLEAPRRTT